MFRFKVNQVNFRERLGKGKFGSVYPYQRNKSEKKSVVKIIKVPHKELPYAIEEIVVGFRCQHPNVLGAQGFDLRPHGINNPKLLKKWENFTEWDVVIKFPRMKESLHSKMKEYENKKEAFPEDKVLKLFHEVTSGLKYLHEKKIAHRDLKPENVLFNEADVALLSDIGLAKFTEDETGYTLQDIAWTQGYNAPEIIPKAKIQKADLYPADIWSLGVVMLQVCSIPEWNTRNDSSLTGKQKEEGLKQDINKLNCSSFLKELLLQMLQAQPKDRISIQDLWEKLDEKLNGKPIIPASNDMVVEDQPIPVPENEEKKNQESSNQSEGSTALKSSMQVEESKGEPLDSEVKMVVDPNDSLKPGEYWEYEENDREASLLSIRNEIKKGYEDLFEFDAGSSHLKIAAKQTAEARDLTDETLGDLLEKLTSEVVDKNCKKLKTFSLSLLFCNEIKGDSFAKLFGSRQLDLINLELDLNATSVNKDGLKELGIQIKKNLQSLENLSIHFPYNVDGAGVGNFAKNVFSKLKNLRQIELTMGGATLLDKECKEISKHIAGLADLEKLRLDLHDCSKLTEAGFRDLFAPIVSNCKNLKHLYLNFSNCQKLDISGLKELSPVLNNLHHLNLNFSKCTKIRDDGVNEIASYVLPSLKNLKHLDLNYSQCKVTDDGLFKLVEQICHLPGLEHLYLGFAGSQSSGGMITGEGLLKVVDPVKSNLKNLQRLHFDLENSNQSVKEVKSEVEESFKDIWKPKISK